MLDREAEHVKCNQKSVILYGNEVWVVKNDAVRRLEHILNVKCYWF